ncbi:MAG: dicarboxylate/amino acid:cation symporter [Deltaproteobacteria bacterium]|nr:dicarboxylate/amino acid:cation symporter [Deltaproteobacteria bacterium]
MLLGLLAGVVLGILARFMLGTGPLLDGLIRYIAHPLGQVYLRLLFMLIIPLVFSALCLGIAGIGEMKSLGRIGVKTLIYTVAISGIAVLIGLTVVNLLRPGDLPDGIREQLLQSAMDRQSNFTVPKSDKTAVELLLNIIPDNVVRAASQSDMLAVMFFALIFGIALAMVRTEATQRLQEVIQGIYDVTWKLIQIVMGLAPYGVAGLMFTITAQLGIDILIQLLRYVGVVLLALALHQFVVYSAVVSWLGKMSPRYFFRAVQDAMVTAFSTASSNATLPTALRVAEEKLGLQSHVSRFVLTVGSTANQNGTALFEGVTVLFLAQLYGVHLSLTQQFLVVIVCILGGVGTAGVPAGSIPVVAMILGMVGIPVEGVGIILGVDRFLDMCRTTLNVTGDLAAAVVINASEKEHGAPRSLSKSAEHLDSKLT